MKSGFKDARLQVEQESHSEYLFRISDVKQQMRGMGMVEKRLPTAYVVYEARDQKSNEYVRKLVNVADRYRYKNNKLLKPTAKTLEKDSVKSNSEAVLLMCTEGYKTPS
jgi:hypothetical protein